MNLAGTSPGSWCSGCTIKENDARDRQRRAEARALAAEEAFVAAQRAVADAADPKSAKAVSKRIRTYEELSASESDPQLLALHCP